MSCPLNDRGAWLFNFYLDILSFVAYFYKYQFLTLISLWYNLIMNNISKRETAINLRKLGKSYGEILDKIGNIPKSTLKYWVKDVFKDSKYLNVYKKLQQKNLKKARRRALIMNKKRQSEIVGDIKRSIEHFKFIKYDKDFLKIVLAVLYLGEGAKWKSHRGLQLGSSDPLILNLYIKLLKKCYKIDGSSIACYICYRADQSLEELVKYWSKAIKIPINNFHKSKPDARTIGSPTKKPEYKGVCILSCGGTRIQQELEMIPKLVFRGL